MKSVLLVPAVIAALGLSACNATASRPATGQDVSPSSATTSQAPATSAAPKSSAVTVTDLTGTWKQTNSNSQEAWQEAVVKDGIIEVFWVSNKGDTRSLFWSGTAERPKSQPFTWTSQGDVEKMKSSILGSQDATKDFTVDNGELSWKASMMGTTTTIRSVKQK